MKYPYKYVIPLCLSRQSEFIGIDLHQSNIQRQRLSEHPIQKTADTIRIKGIKKNFPG